MSPEPTAVDAQPPTETPIYDDLAGTVPGFVDVTHDLPDAIPPMTSPWRPATP